jgi:hypothetical protein
VTDVAASEARFSPGDAAYTPRWTANDPYAAQRVKVLAVSRRMGASFCYTVVAEEAGSEPFHTAGTLLFGSPEEARVSFVLERLLFARLDLKGWEALVRATRERVDGLAEELDRARAAHADAIVAAAKKETP